MNRGISRIAFQLFAEFKDHLLADTLTAEDYDKIALASMIQGVAFMQSCTCIPTEWDIRYHITTIYVTAYPAVFFSENGSKISRIRR